MKTRTIVVGALLVAAALIGVIALHGGNDEKPREVAVAPANPVEPPKASLPPSRQTETPKPIAPVVQVEGAARLPSSESFENASNLRVLADSLAAGLKNGDPEAARTMAKILGECSQAIHFPNFFESFRSGVEELSPEQKSNALAHINRLEQRCADIAKTEKVTPTQLRDLESRGMLVGDVVALAQRVAADPASMSAPERADAVRRIITSRNGEAIYVLADAMEFSDDADNFLLRRHAGQRNDVYAWKLVGCAYGAACNPDGSFARQQCIVLRTCMPGGYREYLRYYLVSPYNYESITHAEQDILSIIASGRTEELLY